MEIGLPWLTLAFLLANGNLSTSTLAVKFLSLCRLKPPTFQIYTTTTFVLLYFTRYIFAKFPQLLGGTKISLLLLFLTSELPSFAALILDGSSYRAQVPHLLQLQRCNSPQWACVCHNSYWHCSRMESSSSW